MANGAEPLLVIRELQRMGARVVNADLTKLPPLRELEPEQGYIRWEMVLDGAVEQQELDECFDFVAPDSLIEYARENQPDSGPASAAATPSADAPAVLAPPEELAKRVDALIEEWTRDRTTEQVVDVLVAARVPVSPVRGLREVQLAFRQIDKEIPKHGGKSYVIDSIDRKSVV